MRNERFEKQSYLTQTWGWLPVLTPVAALGLLLTVWAMHASIANQPYAMLLFWAGILVITLPVGLRLYSRHYTALEAVSLVVLVGVALFLVSMLEQTSQNSSYDGYLHWRTASDILSTQHLFTPNSLLPVSPYFPGLEIVTTALVNLTGLSIFAAGFVVILSARLILTLSLFLILCELGGSLRVGALGSLIYMGSSTFVFFDTQFAYQSLAMPLVVFVFWLVFKRSQIHLDAIAASLRGKASPLTRPGEYWSISMARQAGQLVVLAVMAGLMVAITHHLVSYFMVAILVLWSVIAFIRNLLGYHEYLPTRIALILLVFVAFWLFFIAEITIGYLTPYISTTLATILKFIGGYRGDRPLLPIGQPVGLLSERIAALVSVIVLLLGEGLGLWVWWKARREYRPLQSAFGLVLVMLGFVYPLLPVLHLNTSTWEVSNRMAGPVFMGLALIIGLGLTQAHRYLSNFRLRWGVVGPALGLILCAGIMGGTNPGTRLPGPYLVEADSRSVDSYGLAAAQWAATHLGPDNRMASDRVQSMLMGSLGRQSMVFGGTDGISLSTIFLAPAMSPAQIAHIRQLNLQYLVIDWRITQGPPVYGYYFDNWEQQISHYPVPVNPAVLKKFDQSPDISLIYDNGYIRIYAVGEFTDVP